MSEKVKLIVAYDGSTTARKALDFALARAKGENAEIVIAHVLEWSPYSFLTPEELEERHVRRKEELQRASEVVLAPVLKQLEGSGVVVSTEIKYGHIAETLIRLAEEHNAIQVVIGRTGDSTISSRLFGSVAATLAQACPVPVTIVP